MNKYNRKKQRTRRRRKQPDNRLLAGMGFLAMPIISTKTAAMDCKLSNRVIASATIAIDGQLGNLLAAAILDRLLSYRL
jgi:hypothetical protein